MLSGLGLEIRKMSWPGWQQGGSSLARRSAANRCCAFYQFGSPEDNYREMRETVTRESAELEKLAADFEKEPAERCDVYDAVMAVFGKSREPLCQGG